MRRFVMVRETDLSGVSGEGTVIWGVLWPDGRVSYRWNTATATTCAADSIEDVEKIHGHDGATRLVWLDSPVAARVWELAAVVDKPAVPPVVIPPTLAAELSRRR